MAGSGKNSKNKGGLKKMFNKKDEQTRDSDGKFATTSGGSTFSGLKNFKFNKRIAVFLVLVIAIVGGYLTYQSSAANTGFASNHLQTSQSIGATRVQESRAAKRNYNVVELTNGSNVSTARAVYRNSRIAPGKYDACVWGVAESGSPQGSLSIKGLSSTAVPSLGSEQFTARSGDGYKQLVCLPIETNDSQGLEATVTNQTPNSKLRISSIILEDVGSTHVHEDCTIGQMGQHGPCIDTSTIPNPATGRSSISYDVSYYQGAEPGSFRSRCDFSHMNNDDAILYPGQPGKAHLHTYFGNLGANANSTSQTLLNSGRSTCAGGTLNRSAYWVPSMVNRRTGQVIRPNDNRNQYVSDLEIYYKQGYQGVGYSDMRAFPNGLHMIAGNSPAATGPTSNSKVKYWCESMAPTDRNKRLEGPAIPNCGPEQILVMEVDFPQCWDGRNLTSSNGRTHMAYGTWAAGENRTTTGCPSTHPVGLPFVQMFVRYYTGSQGNADWRLSSDKYSSGPGGYSGHADYMFAWQEEAFQKVLNNCYRVRRDCAYNLGNGQEPQWRRDPTSNYRR